jgi:hypothetical protein
MSQLVLDEQPNVQELVRGFEGWITWVRLQAIRPREQVLDERVPELLLTLNRPTFVTIDGDFWNRKLCHRHYCILFFALATREEHLLPDQLRRLFRLPEFRTRAARMGKVARIQQQVVTYWQAGEKKRLQLPELD